MFRPSFKLAMLASSALAVFTPGVSFAQDTGTGGGSAADTSSSDTSGDIIVTARRRNETSIAVPVVLTAVGGEEMTRRAISSADGVARLVPGLTISVGQGTTQGGTIALRGVAGPDTNPFGDQSVSFNIDGVQIAKSSVRRLAFMDMEQVEVLKGPQALFFGKNSPGGIISIRTADPTSSFAAKASVGYEFNAHEWRGEGFVSGPLTDTLGARVAFYGSKMRGDVKSLVPDDSLYPRFHKYGPHSRDFAVRGTLKFEPNEALTARLKVTYGKVKGAGPAENSQVVFCPLGVSQLEGIVSDCKADGYDNRTDNIGTVFTPFDPAYGDGHTYMKSDQFLTGLELNYAASDSIDITSVTGLYKSNFKAVEHYTRYPVVPILAFGFSYGLPQLPAAYWYHNREFSQELRVNTSFDGPVNVTAGGIYTNTKASTGGTAFINATTPFEVQDYDIYHKGSSYSMFGQVRFQATPQLELTAGGRYSHEEKRIPLARNDLTSSTASPLPVTLPRDKVTFNDFSPEFTISYRPSDRLTVFGSYKRGFLSGGFNGVPAYPGVDAGYGPQKIRGFEAGIKALLLDGTLRANLSVYDYKVPGLQITAFDAAGIVGSLRNAGGARTKGVEFDLNYRPPIDGLTLRGAIAYNHGRYTEYYGPCYNGQSQGQGCNFRALGNGQARPILTGELGNVQDLAGRQMVNAPDWSWNLGANYETPINSSLKFGVSADANFASSVPTDAYLSPGGRSPKRTLIDATARIGAVDDSWELALIGRNLTKKYYWASAQQLAYTAGATGGVTPGLPADYYARLNRGQEIMLRATIAFGN